MIKLNSDYSGPFIPGLQLGEIAPGALDRIARMYCRITRALDGHWYLAVMEKYGNEAALELDRKVWPQVCRYEMARISQLLNIKGTDVATLMKAFQLEPFFIETKFRIDLKNNHYAVLTVDSCPILAALEKENTGRESDICKVVEPEILQAYAAYFNPDIKVTCLKIPPRASQDDIACQWAFQS